jgi:hypothetical protein
MFHDHLDFDPRGHRSMEEYARARVLSPRATGRV